MKILLIAAHPDDEVLGAGGTLVRHVAAGDAVTALIATQARHGVITEAKVQAAAGAIGGIRVRLIGLPYMTLDRDPIGLNRLIEPVVAAIAPDVIYAHWGGDLNSDHRAVAQAAMVAARPIGDRAPTRLLAYETPSSTEWGFDRFAPNVFVDVSMTLEKKLAAIACYEEELRPAPHPRNAESLRARAAYWGQIAGCAYAEPFVLIREVIR